MIQLYTLTPERLNLNGDQGNLLVLAQRARWAGETVLVTALDTQEEVLALSRAIPSQSLLLLGHGSMAAMRSIDSYRPAVIELIAAMRAKSLPVLVVGSCVEWLSNSHEKQERISEFVVADLDGESILGYRNTDAAIESISRDGSVISTMLHGPLLAKNPKLADDLLKSVGVKAKKNDRTKEIDAIVLKVWELEAD